MYRKVEANNGREGCIGRWKANNGREEWIGRWKANNGREECIGRWNLGFYKNGRNVNYGVKCGNWKLWGNRN